MDKHRVLPVNPFTLHFNMSEDGIEKDYRSFLFVHSLKHYRMCSVLAIVFYSMFAFIDHLAVPDHFNLFMIIRFGVVTPMFLVGLGITFLPVYRRIVNYMSSLNVLVTSLGCIVMWFYAPERYQFVYFLGFVICLIFGYAFIRLPFLYATVSGWLAGIAFWAVITLQGGQSSSMLAVYAVFILGIEFLLMAVSYTTERENRNKFHLCHLLNAEKQKTAENNEELEKLLEQVKQLSGLIPICASCKSIRDDDGYWKQLEHYIAEHTEAEFSHSICPECASKYLPDGVVLPD